MISIINERSLCYMPKVTKPLANNKQPTRQDAGADLSAIYSYCALFTGGRISIPSPSYIESAFCLRLIICSEAAVEEVMVQGIRGSF